MGSTRLGWVVVLGLIGADLVGCGSQVAVIPKGRPSPKPVMTTIAPGISVPASQVAPPTYTVSTSHPLPPGVSAQQVVKDAGIDNLIENVAIERQDPALLAYADTGDWLAAIKGEISSNIQQHVRVISVRDEVTALKVGFQSDPKNRAADASVIVQGTEIEVERLASGKQVRRVQAFDVLRWFVWNPADHRYLTCDTGS
ncbi:MAG: hypothetical protein ACYCYK_01835 [Candidatus Dormibacteria bacterium]